MWHDDRMLTRVVVVPASLNPKKIFVSGRVAMTIQLSPQPRHRYFMRWPGPQPRQMRSRGS